MGQSTIQAGADGPLWTPFMTYMAIGVVSQILAMVGTHHAPLGVLLVIGLSVLPIAYSFVADVELWNYAPGAEEWNLNFVKWMIIVPLGGAPLLLVKALRPSATMINFVAALLNLILIANLMISLFYGTGSTLDRVNLAPASMLSASVLLKVATLWCRGESLAKQGSDGTYVYFYTTSTPWVVSYTVWNLVFTYTSNLAGLLEGALQIVYFWCFILYFSKLTGQAESLGYYFGFARGVSLSVVAAAKLFSGFTPYFTEAPQDPPMQQYQALLFFVWINIVFVSFLFVSDVLELCDALRGEPAYGRCELVAGLAGAKPAEGA